MAKLIPIALMFNVMTTPAEKLTGYVSAYDEGPTLATIQYQQEMGRLPLDLSGYDGVIAVLNCGRVGQEAQLNSLRVLVFDCANHHVSKGGAWWMIDGPIVAEVGYGIWQEYPEMIHQLGDLTYADGIKEADRCAWLLPRSKDWDKDKEVPREKVCYTGVADAP